MCVWIASSCNEKEEDEKTKIGFGALKKKAVRHVDIRHNLTCTQCPNPISGKHFKNVIKIKICDLLNCLNLYLTVFCKHRQQKL